MDNRILPFAIKSVTDSGVIEGVISAFGKIDAYGDTIERGAYAKSIEQLRKDGRKLPLLYQHDPTRPIGIWTDLKEGSDGLIGSADLAMEVRDAQEAHALARKGALTGISIGFEIAPGGSRMSGNNRILSDIVLHEASLVTFPADHHARVTGVKSITSVADIEELFRTGGLSGRQAKAAASAAWRTINDRSEDGEAIDQVARLFEQHSARLAANGGF